MLQDKFKTTPNAGAPPESNRGDFIDPVVKYVFTETAGEVINKAFDILFEETWKSKRALTSVKE